jgi:Arc/MetJ-type ribon-helix-helix transcriptional regulator
MADTEKSTIRLSDKDKANVDRIIRTGIASNTAEAIRVALAVAPEFLAMWQNLLTAKVETIVDRLGDLQDELRRERADRSQAELEALARKHDLTMPELRQILAAGGGKLPPWLTDPIVSPRSPGVAIGRGRVVRTGKR